MQEFKNALISVSNKEGLAEALYPLCMRGMRVVSTGGSASLLKKAGIKVVSVEEQSAYPEVLGGRVKTLHPRIYIPLLARRDKKEDQSLLKKENLLPFDLVICNLYPFEEKVRNAHPPHEIMESIDVGGAALLRGAAKNFSSITVICDPEDYPLLKKGPPSLTKRKELAGKAFQMLGEYNLFIAKWMRKGQTLKKTEQEKDFHMQARLIQTLRYGENPHQKASWFRRGKTGLHQAVQLQGKSLSFNNIYDVNSAVQTLKEFPGCAACVAVKHGSPCGVGVSKNSIEEATEKALKADPLSVFGGVLAFNRPLSGEAARLLSPVFLEVCLSPHFSPETLSLLKNKKNLRILKWQNLNAPTHEGLCFQKIQSVEGGLLVQNNPPPIKGWDNQWECVGVQPPPSVKEDFITALRVVSHSKSNAIALVFQGQSVGLSQGQTSRISAVRQALHQWKSLHPEVPCPVLASDGFFPFTDSVEEAHKAGIRWVIQPGGSLKDKEIKQKARDFNLSLVMTGTRYFSH